LHHPVGNGWISGQSGPKLADPRRQISGKQRAFQADRRELRQRHGLRASDSIRFRGLQIEHGNDESGFLPPAELAAWHRLDV
jgi:hypothetical protein